MAEKTVREQAEVVVLLMPRLLRLFFTLDSDDPAMELPIAQIRVCGILSDGPRTVSALSKELGVSVSAATQLTDRLVKAGFVEKCNDGEDKRVKSLRLTSRGHAIMKTRKEHRINRVMDVMGDLSYEERAQVLDCMERVFSICNKNTIDQTINNSEMELSWKKL